MIVPKVGFEPTCVQLLFQLFRRQSRYSGIIKTSPKDNEASFKKQQQITIYAPIDA